MKLSTGRELKHLDCWVIDSEGDVSCSECAGSCDDVLLTNQERSEVAAFMVDRWSVWADRGSREN